MLLLVPLVKLLRRGRRRRTSSWSAVYVNGWQEVLDAARDRGTPVPDGWSRVAQAAQLGVPRDLAAGPMPLSSHPVPPAEEGREFWDASQQLRRRLVAEADAAASVVGALQPGLAPRRLGARGRSVSRQVRHEDRRAGGQQPAGA